MPITSMARPTKIIYLNSTGHVAVRIFPPSGWDIFLNGTTGRKPTNPQEYCKDLDVEKIGDAVAYPSNALAIVSSASSISPQNWRRPTTTGLPISVGRAAIESNTPL